MKNKILIIISLMVFLLVSSVLAANQGGNLPTQTQSKNTTQIQSNVQEQNKLVQQEQIREQVKTEFNQGLQNALLNVKNQNAQMVLEQNVEKFQNKYQTRLQNMNEVMIKNVNSETGEATVSVKEQVKFLGILPVKLQKEFNLDNNGEITEQKKWYSGFFNEGTN